VEKNYSGFEVSFSESPEILWQNFEKTGSVSAFLKFVQKSESLKELELLDLPS
jgi:hypothetical protein